MRQPTLRLVKKRYPVAPVLDESTSPSDEIAFDIVEVEIYARGRALDFAHQRLNDVYRRMGRKADAIVMSTPFYWSFCADLVPRQWPPPVVESWLDMPIYIEETTLACLMLFRPDRAPWGYL